MPRYLSAAITLLMLTNVHSALLAQVTSIPTATPAPQREHSLRPRVRLLSFTTVEASALPVAAQLDRRAYSRGSTVLIRFIISNRTRELIGILDVARDIASVSVYDATGRSVLYQPRIIPWRAILRVPAVAIRGGSRFVTNWYSLAEWGLAPSSRGKYVVSVTSHLRPLNVVLRSQSTAATLQSRSDSLSFSII